MKYSILMPYYDRQEQLKETLKSFVSLYRNRDDYEIIIVEDSKQTEEMEKELQKVLFSSIFSDLFFYIIKSKGKNNYSPSIQYNEGAAKSSGKFLILTNPECKHEVDILGGLDVLLNKNQEQYIVCGCQSLDKGNNFKRWYQHTKHRNARYHFCSCISRVNYYKVGGFNDVYSDGYGYDDNSFRDRVIYSGINLNCQDDLLVSHLWHPKKRPLNYRFLLERNSKLYQKETEMLRRNSKC